MIGLLGISYKTAPIDKRELFSVSQNEIVPLANLLQHEADIPYAVILSTCNRTEIYFSTNESDKLSIIEKVIFLFKKFKSAENQCSRFFYHKFDCDAVRHLFGLASGIDSMIIGEDQILSQLKEAYLYCTNMALTDAVLMRLFQKSFETGKRVRTETDIALGNISVSSTATELCSIKCKNLKNKSILIIGAGETASLTLLNFAKRGIGKKIIINRTLKKAQILAERFNAEVKDYSSLNKELSCNDIIVAATASQKLIINHDAALTGQKVFKKPQIYIDLSVPRNIESKVSQIDNIQLFAVDDLQQVINQNAQRRESAAIQAKSIINEVVDEYNNWLKSRSLRPAIKSINNNLNKVYKQELENFRHFDSPQIKEAVEQYTKHIIHRYSRLLVRNLKQLTNNGQNTDSLDIVKDLFDIEDNNRKK